MAASALHQALAEAVWAELASLATTLGFDTGKVVLLPVPVFGKEDAPNAPVPPAIVVAPFGAETVDNDGGTMTSDDIGYPVLVAHAEPAFDDAGKLIPADHHLNLRELCIDQLIHSHLTSADLSKESGRVNILDTRIEAGPNIDLPAWNNPGLLVGNFIARVVVRKQRRAA